MSKVKPPVEVAVAVLHYQARYLLAYRHKAQHQGERFEFVGGKIETDETAQAALVREVQEEIGLALSREQLTKLGRITHNYGDKQVRLHIYDVAMTARQYESFATVSKGCEGQPLRWVDKSALLAGEFPLPAANLPILTWLTLPTEIIITHELGCFSQENHPQESHPIDAWTEYHAEHLPHGSTVYIRPKVDSKLVEAVGNIEQRAGQGQQPEQQANLVTLTAVMALITARADIKVILPELLVSKPEDDLTYSEQRDTPDNTAIKRLLAELNQVIAAQRVLAQHCSHKTLIEYVDTLAQAKKSASSPDNSLVESLLGDKLPLLVSCHDLVSIAAANTLANHRIQHGQPVVLGAFLSPVCTTLTHPDSTPLGWSKFSQLSERMDLPVIALGGLTPADREQARGYGGICVAGIRAFLQEHATYIS